MFTPGRKHYTRVAALDEDDGEEQTHALHNNQPWDQGGVQLTPDPEIRQRRRLLTIILIITYTFVVLSIGAVIAQGLKEVSLARYLLEPSQHRCTKLGIRREWRSLSSAEQKDYTNAAVCFSALKNPHGSNGTLYDEFSRVHRSVGALSHEAASFLPWHRYFLRIYEAVLETECGFKGSVPYWDWTLDWQAFSKSPIWNATTGFGGDGNSTAGQGVGEGSCVTDGPFSTLRPVYYNKTSNTHCLSRGFGVGNDSEELLSHTFSPTAIEELLHQETYERFLAQVEGEIHNSIHRLIGGDFRAWTAPNDPIFYLHHAQLDHLWWLWQQNQPSTRLSEYTGQHMVNSSGNATLTDRLFMGSLAVDVSVADVMSIQGRAVCSNYI